METALERRFPARRPIGRVSWRRLSYAAAFAVVAGCGGSDGTSPNSPPGPPAKLAFVVQPSGGTAGRLAPVRVAVKGVSGRVVTSFAGQITISIDYNPSGGLLSGTLVEDAVQGVGSFTDLSIDFGGTGYTLAATASGLTGATSEPFDNLPRHDVWTTRSPLPDTSEAFGAAVVNGVPYVIGGLDVHFQPMDRVVAYDPVPRGYPGVAAIAGRLYAMGGDAETTGFYSNPDIVATTEVYDPVTDAWSSSTPLSGPRHAMAACTANGLLYVIGGEDASAELPTLESFDPATNAWTQHASMPAPRGFLACGLVNGALFAVGGTDSFSTEKPARSNYAYIP